MKEAGIGLTLSPTVKRVRPFAEKLASRTYRSAKPLPSRRRNAAGWA